MQDNRERNKNRNHHRESKADPDSIPPKGNPIPDEHPPTPPGVTTRIYARRLWEILYSYSTTVKDDQPAGEVRRTPRRHVSTHSQLLFLLKFVPWLLSGLFILSFFIELQGAEMTLFSITYPLNNILRIISVSGLIGFLTNRLAITMLFRPLNRRPLLGQGLIPAQKELIAFRLASAVSEDLINPELIKQKIHDSNAVAIYREQAVNHFKKVLEDPDFRLELKKWSVGYVDEMVADPDFRAGLARKILLEMENSLKERSLERIAIKAYSYLRSNEIQNIIEKSLSRLPETVEQGLDKLDDLMDSLPGRFSEHGDTIENIATNLLYKLINRLDVHDLVEGNLKQYNEEKLEKLIKGASNEQLLYIQYLGGVLGMVGGLVIWQPLLSISILSLLALLIVILDRTLMKLKKK